MQTIPFIHTNVFMLGMHDSLFTSVSLTRKRSCRFGLALGIGLCPSLILIPWLIGTRMSYRKKLKQVFFMVFFLGAKSFSSILVLDWRENVVLGKIQ